MTDMQGHKEVISFRLPRELAAALRKLAQERHESLTDVLCRASFLVLGICPQCQGQSARYPQISDKENTDVRKD